MQASFKERSSSIIKIFIRIDVLLRQLHSRREGGDIWLFITLVPQSLNNNVFIFVHIHFTIGQYKCILAYHWSIVLYDVIFY